MPVPVILGAIGKVLFGVGGRAIAGRIAAGGAARVAGGVAAKRVAAGGAAKLAGGAAAKRIATGTAARTAVGKGAAAAGGAAAIFRSGAGKLAGLMMFGSALGSGRRRSKNQDENTQTINNTHNVDVKINHVEVNSNQQLTAEQIRAIQANQRQAA